MLLYDASTAKNPQTKVALLKCPRSITSVRPEHGYSVKIYDRSTDTWPATLRSQFGRKYDQKKVGNIYQLHATRHMGTTLSLRFVIVLGSPTVLSRLKAKANSPMMVATYGLTLSSLFDGLTLLRGPALGAH
jgi:hypothetical protein